MRGYSGHGDEASRMAGGCSLGGVAGLLRPPSRQPASRRPPQPAARQPRQASSHRAIESRAAVQPSSRATGLFLDHARLFPYRFPFPVCQLLPYYLPAVTATYYGTWYIKALFCRSSYQKQTKVQKCCSWAHNNLLTTSQTDALYRYALLAERSTHGPRATRPPPRQPSRPWAQSAARWHS